MEDLYLSTLKLAAQECINQQQTDDAIQLLRLAIAKEPLNESLRKDSDSAVSAGQPAKKSFGAVRRLPSFWNQN